MAITFPSNPQNGDTFSSGNRTWQYNSAKGIWVSVPTTVSKNLLELDSDIIPASNVTYSLGTANNAWSDLYVSGNTIHLGATQLSVTAEGGLQTSVGGQAVKIGGGVTNYNTFDDLPSDGNSEGDLGYILATKKMYVWNGAEWSMIFLGPDIAPEWVIEPSGNEIDIPPNSNKSISGMVQDPDGFGITYDYDLSNNSILTGVTNVGNGTFDIATGSATGALNFRYKATDGVNVLSKVIPLNVFAYNYDLLYTAATGGNIVSVTYSGSGVDNLDATIDAMSDHDCLALGPGTYSINCATGIIQTGASIPFRNKKIAIIGKTDNAKNVVVTIYHDSTRDKPIFSSDTNGYNHLANFRMIRDYNTGTNYIQAMVRGNEGTLHAGTARNMIFDFNGGSPAWLYDNNNHTGGRVYFDYCSFVNYVDWQNNYTGSIETVRVNGAAHATTDTHITSGATFEGDASYQGQNFSTPDYTYPQQATAGHLSNVLLVSGDIVLTDIH